MNGSMTWLGASRLLFVAVAWPVLGLGLFVSPSDDDFSHWYFVGLAESPLAYAATVYQNWSGRFMTEVLNGIAFSRPDLFSLFVLVPPLAFALLPIALYMSLESFEVEVGGPAVWLLAALGMAALYLVLLPYLADCVFWLTGGIGYALPLLGSVLWLAALTRRGWPGYFGAGALILLTIPASLVSEQTSAAMFAGAIATALLRRRVSMLFVVATAFLVAGSLILIVAPGNAARAAAGPHGLAGSPLVLVTNYVWVIGSTWDRFINPLVGGVSVGLIGASLGAGAKVNRAAVLVWSAVMLAATVGATLPFAAVPDFVVQRTAFIPGAYLLAATAGASFALLAGPMQRFSRAKTLGVGLATCLVAAHLGLVTLNWQHAGARPQTEAVASR